MTPDTDIEELREKLEPHVAAHGTEEAKEKIQNSSMIYEIWEDGEVTSTKAGDLFRKRTLHMIRGAFLNEDLWEVPEERDHVSRVVINDEARDILDEYR